MLVHSAPGQRRVRVRDGRRAGVYQRAYGDNEVLVCLDETGKPQVSETGQPRPSRPGAAQTYDHEYHATG